MKSNQGKIPLRQNSSKLEKELTEARAELAKARKINRAMARQVQRAEQERQRQQETFDLICGHGSDLLAILGLSGRIGFLSRTAETALGYSEQELLGRLLQDICHAEDRKALGGFLAGLEKESESSDARFRLLHKRDGAVVFEMFARMVPHPQTGAPEVMAILRRPNETRLGEGLDDLGASLAHELNQPLTAIALTARACVRMARSDKSISRDLVEAIDTLAVQAERAGELVRRMRQLMSGGSPRRSPTDLNAAAREALNLLGHDLKVQGVEVRLRLAESLPPMSADTIQVGQIILNLVRNAIEAMQASPAGSRQLTLTTSRRGGSVHLTLSDTGPGIDPHFAQRLFRPFQSTKPGGMGLGLALSQSIAQAHGGRLWVAEPNKAEPGKSGATFFLSLPIHGQQP